ncbi:glycosyltransferase family 2 protein [Desulfoluna butyratoxydans]|uniref:Nucleotide-diphospho-sugar transferases n=1 Tax=Desulfoluna butyratoxydans TaxID=231438 RepID=A0A4V6ILX0_9BACT|nr:glycosyltransferase family 2 protein [Desulfoluna butyratoxydans]VFQ46488.1 nucleotide-diphospho-sugar transferases [Desulfoluna butyratoxydans]
MAQKTDLSIIVVSFNTCELTRKCLACVRDHGGEVRREIIVVDNASTDGSPEMIEAEFPEVTLIRLPVNVGFAGGNNPGMKRASGRYILLLNSDAFIEDGVLEKTMAYMDANPRTGILGCRLTNPDGTLQPSARSLPGPINKFFHISGLAARFPASRIFGKVDYTWWDHSTPRKVGWVVGAFFLIRRRTMETIGFLDDGYFLYFEEIDYCLAAQRAYWDVVFYPHASVVHIGGQSTLKTPGRISTHGRQSLAIRIASECRYYQKCYGRMRLLAAMAVEYLWNGLIRLKHTLSPTRESPQKKADAAAIMELILNQLRRPFKP